jgi:hypothetical protein
MGGIFSTHGQTRKAYTVLLRKPEGKRLINLCRRILSKWKQGCGLNADLSAWSTVEDVMNLIMNLRAPDARLSAY